MSKAVLRDRHFSFMEIKFSSEVEEALNSGRPVVALESTVIAHGLPFPQNLETALAMENVIRSVGAVPATIAVFGGKFYAGLDDSQIEQLATAKDIRKISRRDLALATALKLDCATTVATTAFIADRAGIRIFATGGIGGVHREFHADVSADLIELVRSPVTIVCSGPKIVLDLERTREWLETFGITVLGWQSDDMPAFYSRSSGLPVDQRVESAGEVAAIAAARDALDLTNAIVVMVPVPADSEIERSRLEKVLVTALDKAAAQGISGKEITPFLLAEMAAQSGGETLAANIALLKNNARVAAEIAVAIARIN